MCDKILDKYEEVEGVKINFLITISSLFVGQRTSKHLLKLKYCGSEIKLISFCQFKNKTKN